MRPKLLVLLAAITVGATAVWGQTALSEFPSDEEIRRILADRIDTDHWSVGMVVGLISPEGRRVVSYGRASRGDVPTLNADTVFEIASITKVFTSLVLADMVLRREVTLDDPIEKFLPAGVTAPTRNGKSVTLQDLATHTSGLPRQPSNLAPRDPTDPYADYSVAKLYAFLSSTTLARDIGSTYDYSNVGAGLLGHVLALKSGTDYDTLLTTRVLKPLGMNDTSGVLSAEMARRAATGHNVLLQPVASWGRSEALAGMGGLRSTANDLLTLLSAVLSSTHPAIRDATALMLSAPRPTAKPNLMIGLGWHLRQFVGRTIVFHDGGSGGQRAFVGFDREARTGVVVLSNTNSEADLNDIGLHLLDRRAVLLTFRPTAPGDPALLDRYVGVYEFGPGVEITVRRYGWILYAKPTGQPALPLSSEAEREFSIRDVDLTRPPVYRPEVALRTRLTFEVDATGRATTLIREDDGRVTRGARVR